MSTSNFSEMNSKFRVSEVITGDLQDVRYSDAPHNDVSFNDELLIRRWSHKIIIFYYNIYYNIMPVPVAARSKA